MPFDDYTRDKKRTGGLGCTVGPVQSNGGLSHTQKNRGNKNQSFRERLFDGFDVAEDIEDLHVGGRKKKKKKKKKKNDALEQVDAFAGG